MPDLFRLTPTTSAQTGQKFQAAGSSRHVAAFQLKGTVHAPPPSGGIDACGEFVFSFALIQRRQRSGSVAPQAGIDSGILQQSRAVAEGA